MDAINKLKPRDSHKKLLKVNIARVRMIFENVAMTQQIQL
jgi:hypothetical protein